MTYKTALLKKIIGIALVGAFAAGSVVTGNITAHAASVAWEHKDNRGRNRVQAFTGTVINVNADKRFSIRADGKIYDVKTDYHLPRRLSKGDVVRVVGQRSRNNDVVHARVEIIRKASVAQDESFTGVISKIKSDQRFEFRVNGKTFDVTTADRLSRYLKKGDVVRVSGRRSASSKISNAKVVQLNRR